MARKHAPVENEKLPLSATRLDSERCGNRKLIESISRKRKTMSKTKIPGLFEEILVLLRQVLFGHFHIKGHSHAGSIPDLDVSILDDRIG